MKKKPSQREMINDEYIRVEDRKGSITEHAPVDLRTFFGFFGVKDCLFVRSGKTARYEMFEDGREWR